MKKTGHSYYQIFIIELKDIKIIFKNLIDYTVFISKQRTPKN